MKLQHWLVKQEPESYAWEAFFKDGTTVWDGVRNFQARNNLKLMKKGDPVLFYASGGPKTVMGLAEVSKTAFPDASAEEPGWVAVELKALRALAKPVSLQQIKADPALAQIALVRNSRLSVMPLDAAAFARIVRLGQ